jgi:hypothetical protein
VKRSAEMECKDLSTKSQCHESVINRFVSTEFHSVSDVRFEVLTAACVKNMAFCVVTLCTA